MDEATLRALMERVATGAVAPDEAMVQLRRLPFADLGFARIDHHRQLRQGFPEAVYAPGKSPEHCVAVIGELLANGQGPVVLSRTDVLQRAACLARHPAGEVFGHTVVWRATPPRPDSPAVAVLTAGTADLPVAEECVAVLAAHGIHPRRLDDVGVSGLHRLLASLDQLEGLDAAVVVAGMEGALASVIGGLVDVPVIAVPTSVGYGAGLAGVTALLAMLSSCASGVTVVGIDNGFGAACAVVRLLGRPARVSPAGDAGPEPRSGPPAGSGPGLDAEPGPRSGSGSGSGFRG